MSTAQNQKPRRVILLTTPALYGAAIINTLVQMQGIDVVGVGLTTRVFKGKGPVATLRRLIRSWGVPYTWYSILVTRVAWMRLRLTGRPWGLKSIPKGDVRYLADVNAADTVAWMASLSPDFVASFYFNQWIGAEVRAVPRLACVNMHPGLLPELRGPDPVFRALQKELTQSGVTLHQVADDFDAGEVLYQERLDIPKKASVLDVYFAFVERGAHVLAEWLAGRISRTDSMQSGADGEYLGFPTPQEVRQFRHKGNRLGGFRELRKALATIR
jgi:methionyl-tRNA formyltransferase